MKGIWRWWEKRFARYIPVRITEHDLEIDRAIIEREAVLERLKNIVRMQARGTYSEREPRTNSDGA
jgi:hypothetical protein